MSALPTGNVTFLFTDIEGSTRLIAQHPDAMKEALARHHVLLETAIESHRGRVFQIVGDAFLSAFENANDALSAALEAQRALHGQKWGEVGTVRVRMGLHTGAAEAREGDYVSSLTLARVQRVASAGHGGQTLLSSAAAEGVAGQLPRGTTLRDLGPCKLRGLPEPENVYQLVVPDLPSEFPPLRVEESGESSAASLGQLIRGKLVGRAAELQQLKQHWDQALQARGHLVLVSGEPGVGKTRLAQDLIAHAQKSGATVLRGGCYEYEATTPYLPIVEAFREWVHWQSAEHLRAKLGPSAAEIAKLAPEIESKLGALSPNPPLPPNEERLRLFDNVARFLQSLAADNALLVFVDDLHWADQGTLSLLSYFLRRVRNDRVLILAAYREIELDRAHPLATALVDWNRERLATRIALGRLSLADTGALLAALFGQESVSDEFTAALYRETEGNPFFVEEVVKALIEQGQIYREEGRWGRKETHELAIPQSVKEAIGRRLNRLSDETVDALRTAAALGKIFLFRELVAVSSAEEDALLDALDEASAAQLIRVNAAGGGARSAGGDSFAFTHDKIREVLYEELNPIRRRRLHQRIGETLERLFAPAGATDVAADTRSQERAQDLAYHFTQAGDLEKALRYSLRAAEDAEHMFAHDEALKFLEQARESAEALNRTEDVVAVDERIGDIHEMRGVIRAAVEAYERALTGATTAEARAALKAKVGNAYSPVDDPRGFARLEEAVNELDPKTQTNALALATALIGRHYHYRTEHRKAIEFLERARQLAEPLDDPPTLVNIYSYLAGAHQHLLEYEPSDHWARVCIALGERTRFPLAIALGNEFLGENCVGRGYWDKGLAFGALDYEQGMKIGSQARMAWSGFCNVQGFHGKGELRKALSAAHESLALCEQIGEERLAVWLDAAASFVAADLGEDDAARMMADRGWERACHLNQLLLSAWALYALGYAAMQRGDFAAALDWFEQYVALVRDTENGIAKSVVMARAAEAFLYAKRTEEAAQLAERAIAVTEAAGAVHYLALARRVRAQILAERGEHAAALREFDQAIAGFTPIGSRLELARASCLRAALLLQQSQPSERQAARAAIAAARDAFTAMEALHDASRAETLLRG